MIRLLIVLMLWVLIGVCDWFTMLIVLVSCYSYILCCVLGFISFFALFCIALFGCSGFVVVVLSVGFSVLGCVVWCGLGCG